MSKGVIHETGDNTDQNKMDTFMNVELVAEKSDFE